MLYTLQKTSDYQNESQSLDWWQKCNNFFLPNIDANTHIKLNKKYYSNGYFIKKKKKEIETKLRLKEIE